MNDKIKDDELEKKIDEAFMPELGGEKITIGGRELHLTEMPIFHVKKLNRALGPVYTHLSGQQKLGWEDLLSVTKIEGFYDMLLDAGAIVTERIDPSTNRAWLEQNASERELLRLLHTQMRVNGLTDFFVSILRGVMSSLNLTAMLSPHGSILSEPSSPLSPET